MRRHIVVIGIFSASLALGAEDVPQRQMNVTQGPEAVFDRPPAEILPSLVGAEMTGDNGRVGNELVFWGYRQAAGGRVFFFACAQVAEVDCAQRTLAICPANTRVLETQQVSGNIVRRSCRNITVTTPGDVRPGCDDREQDAPLLVGLVACG